MAAPGSGGLELAEVLAELIEGTVEGLRAYPYVADTVRPPAVVIGEPDVDFTDARGGFGAAVWSFPLTLVVSRSTDRDAQRLLLTHLRALADALHVDPGAGPGELAAVEPVDARPVAVTVSGQELPGYLLTVRVTA